MIVEPTASSSDYFLQKYRVARHLADMQAVYTYDGTDTMLALIVGREITGLGAFA